MNKLTIRFDECEHTGDLENYEEDVTTCGGRVKSRSLNEDAETGKLQIEVDDVVDFRNKFKKTESADFATISR